MIFRKYYRGGIFPIQVLQVEDFDSASVKKKIYLDSVQMAKISRFYTIATKSASAVHGVGARKVP